MLKPHSLPLVAETKPRHMGVPGLGGLVGKSYYANIVGTILACIFNTSSWL